MIVDCCALRPPKCPVYSGKYSAKDKDGLVKVKVKEEAERKYDQWIATQANIGIVDIEN